MKWPASALDLSVVHYGWWNLWLLAGPVAASVPRDLDSLANARRCSAPAVFISACADGVIPATYHRQVINAYAGPKRIIEMPGAGHDTPLTREAAEQFSVDLDWLWQLATRATSQSAPTR